MKKVNLEITNCRQCPFFQLGIDYSLDGWDRGSDWFCNHNPDKKKTIAEFVERESEAVNTSIPDWCPISK